MIKKTLLVFHLIFILTCTVYAQFNESNTDSLKYYLDAITNSVNASGTAISVKVVHADLNRELYSFKPELELIPASISKIVTSSCAFYKLGPGYNIKTAIYTDDNNLNDGEVNGNLYLKGYGDPDLNSSDINNLANQVMSRNIKKVTGNIVYDDSYFDNNYYSLSGSYSGDTGPSYWPFVSAIAFNKGGGQSASNCASYFSSLLSSAGIELQSVIISGRTPEEAKEIAQISHSLFDILSYMNKESDNQSAITIFKLLGAKLVSEPGSLEKGQKAIESYLSEIGVPRYSYEILEGSGLTRYNRVNAEMYMKILKVMYDDKLLFDYFLNSLSIAGKEGTLRNRMIGTEAEGNVYAKTGTLNGVSALSGYVIDRDNEILIFYVVMNGFGGSSNLMRSVQDDICILLSQFTRK